MNRLGMTLLVSHPQSPSFYDQFALYKQTGFDSVFIGSGTVSDLDNLPSLSDGAKRCGILLEAFHAPTVDVGGLWSADGQTAETALRKLCDAVDACHAADIGKLVLHAAGGAEIPAVCGTGAQAGALSRFSRLEDYAALHGVVLCYENAKVLPPFASVLGNAAAPHGFCFDAGHQTCYGPDAPIVETYGSRMLYTHLHDNDGTGDRHFLPFDGIRDWNALAEALARVGYRGTLNLELACHSSQAYRDMPFEAFVREAYARLTRFAEILHAYS